MNVFVDGSDELYKCKVILDQKSSDNLCSESLVETFGLSGT